MHCYRKNLLCIAVDNNPSKGEQTWKLYKHPWLLDAILGKFFADQLTRSVSQNDLAAIEPYYTFTSTNGILRLRLLIFFFFFKNKVDIASWPWKFILILLLLWLCNLYNFFILSYSFLCFMFSLKNFFRSTPSVSTQPRDKYTFGDKIPAAIFSQSTNQLRALHGGHFKLPSPVTIFSLHFLMHRSSAVNKIEMKLCWVFFRGLMESVKAMFSSSSLNQFSQNLHYLVQYQNQYFLLGKNIKCKKRKKNHEFKFFFSFFFLNFHNLM